MAKTEIRMTGSGGQGVIMGTIIIAEAAYEDGKHVVQCHGAKLNMQSQLGAGTRIDVIF